MKFDNYFGRLILLLLCSSSLLRAHADLKSTVVVPSILSVGSMHDRVLWNLRPSLEIRHEQPLGSSSFYSYSLAGRIRADTQAEFVSTGQLYETKIDNAAIQWQGNRAAASFGFQKYTWGDSAFFDGVDMLNPRDLTEPLYSDDELAKIAVPSVNLQYLGENKIFQTVVVLKAMRTPIADSIEGVTTEDVGEREWFKDAELGLKAGGLMSSGWDINGYMLSYYERVPQFFMERLTPSPLVLQLNEPRVFTLGVTATQSVDSYVYRAELALHSQRAKPGGNVVGAATADQVVFHGTADATFLDDVLTTFEAWGEHWFANSTPAFNANSFLFGVRSQKPFWDSRVEVTGAFLFAEDFSERWASFGIQAKPFGGLQFGADAHWAHTSTGRVLARRGLKNLIRSNVSYQF